MRGEAESLSHLSSSPLRVLDVFLYFQFRCSQWRRCWAWWPTSPATSLPVFPETRLVCLSDVSPSSSNMPTLVRFWLFSGTKTATGSQSTVLTSARKVEGRRRRRGSSGPGRTGGRGCPGHSSTWTLTPPPSSLYSGWRRRTVAATGAELTSRSRQQDSGRSIWQW